MSLDSLSRELPRAGYDYQLNELTRINHQFYVDDLKLYGTNDNQLNGLVNTVKMISYDIMMIFGLDKSAKATFKKGGKVCRGNTLIDKCHSRSGIRSHIHFP